MSKPKKVLIIEDEIYISEMYARTLTLKGYNVDLADNGPEGLEKAQKSNYDLVLLDLMMPVMDGIEILGKLRGKDGKGLPKTKIVILTNLAQNKSSKQKLESQVDGYLIKADVVPSKLAAFIDQLL